MTAIATTIVLARATRALVRAMGMQALNALRAQRGETLAYDDEGFFALLDEEHLTEADIRALLGAAEETAP